MGVLVGESVGPKDGDLVGPRVGESVGESVGSGVGIGFLNVVYNIEQIFIIRPYLGINNKQRHVKICYLLRASNIAVNLFYLYTLVVAFYRTIFCPLALYLPIPMACLLFAVHLFPLLHTSLG